MTLTFTAALSNTMGDGHVISKGAISTAATGVVIAAAPTTLPVTSVIDTLYVVGVTGAPAYKTDRTVLNSSISLRSGISVDTATQYMLVAPPPVSSLYEMA